MELFTHELLDYLPPKARSSAIALDAERSAAWAVLRDLVDRVEDAHRRKSAAEVSARSAEERFPDRRLSEEDRQRLAAPVARITEELATLKAQHDRAHKAFQAHGYLQGVVAWVRDARASRVRLRDAAQTSVKAADASKRVEEIRRKLDEVEQEFQRVADAPRTIAELRAAFEAELDRLVERGAPTFDPRIREGSPIKLAQAGALSIAGTSLIGDVEGCFAIWCAQDEIRRRGLAMIGDKDVPGALSDDAREAAFDRLNAERLKLEREEAALVAAAAENGLAIPHRSDIDPRAVLMVEEA